MERISKLLILGGVITHTVVLFQSGFELSLESLNADPGGAAAQCSQFKSLMTLAFIFACIAIGFSALPMLKRTYRNAQGCKQKEQKEGKWTKLLIKGSLLATLYLQAAATFQERTLSTCGDFTNNTLVLVAGVLTLLGFLGILHYKQQTQYITIGSVIHR